MHNNNLDVFDRVHFFVAYIWAVSCYRDMPLTCCVQSRNIWSAVRSLTQVLQARDNGCSCLAHGLESGHNSLQVLPRPPQHVARRVAVVTGLQERAATRSANTHTTRRCMRTALQTRASSSPPAPEAWSTAPPAPAQPQLRRHVQISYLFGQCRQAVVDLRGQGGGGAY